MTAERPALEISASGSIHRVNAATDTKKQRKMVKRYKMQYKQDRKMKETVK